MKLIGTFIFALLLSITGKGQTADFIISTAGSSFCAPQVITFRQTSTGDPESLVWDFGNGKTGNQPVEHITYLTPGTYTIRLIAVYRNVAVTKEKTITINPTPSIRLSTSGTSLCKTGEVRFTATGMNILRYVWDFNDGTPEVTTTAGDIRHNFTEFGTYNVRVTGYNAYGCHQTTSKTININPLSLSGTMSVSSGCIPSTPRFRIQTRLLPDDAFAEVKWEFGDGSAPAINAANNISHTYNTTNRITEARVTLTTQQGCESTYTFPEFGFGTPPTDLSLSFTANRDTFCGSEKVELLGNATNAAFIVWNYGDGGSDSLNTPTTKHKYTRLGEMMVSATPYFNGCAGSRDSISVNIRGVIAKFNVTNTCSALNTFHFPNLSLGNIEEYKWTFSDVPLQTDITNFSATHTFPTEGSFYTRLFLHDNITGCSDSIQKQIYTALPLLRADKYLVCKDSAIRYFIENDYAAEAGFTYAFNINGEVVNNGRTNHLEYNPSNFGMYNDYVVIKDNYPLTCDDTVRLSDPVRVRGPVADFSITGSVCFDSTVSIVNHSYPYYDYEPISAYSWDYGNGETSHNNTPADYYFPEWGNYTATLTATDISGCRQTAAKPVSIHPLPIVDILPRYDTLCLGDTTTLIAYSSDNITWSSLADMSCFGCDTVMVHPAQSTNYVVNALSEFGCRIRDSVLINVITPITATLTASPAEVCQGQSTILSLDTDKNALIQWLSVVGMETINQQNIQITPQLNNYYQVMVSDRQNCFSDTADISIIVYPPPLVYAGNDISGMFNERFTLQPVYGNNITSYSWSPLGGNLSCTNCPNPSGVITMPQEYTIRVTDQNGCEAEDKVSVGFNCKNAQLVMPNAFTPNGDGLNDYFYPIARGIDKIIAFVIFDRQGTKIFERSNFSPNASSLGWNGQTPKSNNTTTQTYVWMIQVECEGSTITHKGTVTLIR